MKSFRFKLYKSDKNAKLHKQINAAGLIYNHCIALHKRYYKIFGKYLNKNQLQKHLVKLKRMPEFGYIKETGSQSVQDITDRIDKAFRLFFSNLKRKVRCSPPNFKKVVRYKSFTLKQKAGWKLDENTCTLKVNGQNYRCFRSRRISGKVKTVTIKRDSLGDFYVCIVTDAKDFAVETRTGKSVGFDFGLKKIFNCVGRERHNQSAVFCAKFNRDKKCLQKSFKKKERFKQSAKSSFESCAIVQKNI